MKKKDKKKRGATVFSTGSQNTIEKPLKGWGDLAERAYKGSVIPKGVEAVKSAVKSVKESGAVKNYSFSDAVDSAKKIGGAAVDAAKNINDKIDAGGAKLKRTLFGDNAVAKRETPKTEPSKKESVTDAFSDEEMAKYIPGKEAKGEVQGPPQPKKETPYPPQPKPGAPAKVADKKEDAVKIIWDDEKPKKVESAFKEQDRTAGRSVSGAEDDEKKKKKKKTLYEEPSGKTLYNE